MSISANTERNFTVVDVNDTTLYFSYHTLVAFDHKGQRYVSENAWSTTTAKHLNSIDGGDSNAKKNRLKQNDFINLIQKLEITMS